MLTIQLIESRVEYQRGWHRHLHGATLDTIVSQELLVSVNSLFKEDIAPTW